MRKPARERRKNEEEECFLRKPSTCVTMKPTNLAILAPSTTRSTKITKRKKKRKKPKLQPVRWKSGNLSAHLLQPRRQAAEAVVADRDQHHGNQHGRKQRVRLRK